MINFLLSGNLLGYTLAILCLIGLGVFIYALLKVWSDDQDAEIVYNYSPVGLAERIEKQIEKDKLYG